MIKRLVIIGIATLLAGIAPANARIISCVGEPGTGRAIGGGQSSAHEFADSVIGDCLFNSGSQIGRRIDSVCHIGQIGGDDTGTPCQVEAEVVRKGRPSFDVIKRVIKVERLPGSQ
jgi:hypothetical protein